MLTPGADPVRKISIIPRGQALGVTLSTPESDRYSYRREELLAQIKVALGGRAAEKVVFDDLSTGAESDIQNLTQVARGMVGRWGMSDAVGRSPSPPSDRTAPLLPGAIACVRATQELVDEEMQPDRRRGERGSRRLARDIGSSSMRLADALLDREARSTSEKPARSPACAARRAGRGRGQAAAAAPARSSPPPSAEPRSAASWSR